MIGKGALTVDGPGPDLGRVREGLKVVVFEQTSEVLEQRLGFRVTEYGLRNVYKRIPDHPLLAGLEEDHLRDWRGEATILPPRLSYEIGEKGTPSVQWCGIEVTRAWRAGCRGNVASVLIEKPARGNFLPIVDGGYSLQYSPLMEYREGDGMVLFCQMDVTGRTEGDPAAEILTRNIIEYLAGWKPAARRKAVYVGGEDGEGHLRSIELPWERYEGEPIGAERLLIVAPGGGDEVDRYGEAIRQSVEAGGHVLAVGLDEKDAGAIMPLEVAMKRGEHIGVWFESAGIGSPLAGIGPADVHNRDPRELPLITGGATPVGNGVLAASEGANVVFCQLAPWAFRPLTQMNIKRTFRRVAVLFSRLLGNMGVTGSTPLLSRFASPVTSDESVGRWLDGLYLDEPEEWDDPYRFFRW